MNRRLVLVAPLTIALFAVLAWRAADRPLVADEVEFVQTSTALVRSGQPLACDGLEQSVILHHPQGYHLILGATLEALGHPGSPLVARLPGLLSLLLTLPLTYLLGCRLARSPATSAGWPAVVLLLAAPLAIQGSLVVDIDNTVLTPALLGFLLVLMRHADQERSSALSLAGSAGLFALLLWIKLPTPFLATAALAGAGLLTRGRRRLVLESAAITALGAILFALSWWAFCAWLGLDPLGPLSHLAGRGADRAALTLTVLGKRALRLGFWLGPWLPMAAALAARRLWSTDPFGRQPSPRVAALYVALVLLGYLGVGGEAFGFTRYHVPLVPVLAGLAATTLGQSWIVARRATILGAGLVAAMLLVAGDPLLPWYTLREALAAGDIAPGKGSAWLLVSSAVWLAPLVVVVVAPRWGVAAGDALVIAAVVAGLVVSVHQLGAAYSTNYLYGERGMDAAIHHLATRGPEPGLVIAPKDLAFASLPCGSYAFTSRSLSRGQVRPLLERDQLSLLVIRRGHFADRTVRGELFDPIVQATLAERFDRTRVGDFIFFERVITQ